MKKLLILLMVLIGVLTVTISSASAQDCPTTGIETTATFTEGQINGTFRVTNPLDRNLSNIYVDLQSANGGQVEMSATYSYRSTSGVQNASVDVILLPVLSNGRVDWSVTSVTVNGQPVSGDLLTQINDHIAASWHRWISDNAPAGSITGVTITDDDITYTFSPWVPGCTETEEPLSTEEVTEAPLSDTSLPASGNGSPSGNTAASGTLTITEAQINSSFGVTNPADRNLSAMSIDLQAANGGQVVISANYTYRTLRGVQTAPIALTVVPSISNGRVDWSVTSLTVNGQPASSGLVSQINDHMSASWLHWISDNAPKGVITGVTITDNDITYSYTP